LLKSNARLLSALTEPQEVEDNGKELGSGGSSFKFSPQLLSSV